MIPGYHEITQVDQLNGTGQTVNVIIPGHNSSSRIGHVIDNIGHQFLPSGADLSLIVCANACIDDTAIVVEQAFGRLSHKRSRVITRLIVTNEPGEPQALNNMVASLDHPGIVIGINDDCFPTRDSLWFLYSTMVQQPELGAIGIRAKPIPNYKHHKASLTAKVAAAMARGDYKAITGRMYGFRPAVIGPFPDIIAEDVYLTVRPEEYGIVSADGIYVYYRLPRTLTDIWLNILTYRRAEIQFKRIFPEYSARYREIQGSGISRKKRLIERGRGLLGYNQEYTRMERLLGFSISRTATLVANYLETRNPSKDSSRTRIQSAI